MMRTPATDSLKKRKTKGTERQRKTETGKKKKRHIITIRYEVLLLFCSFSVDRVSHNDEAKPNRMRRRDPLPVASKEMGMGGVAVVEKPWLTKVGRRRQTG